MILVTGATGNVGGEVVGALARAGNGVRALTRDPSKAAFPVGVDPVAGDLSEPDSLGPALDGVSAVFLLAGYPDPPALLAAMTRAGVRRVVLLSTGAVEGGDLDNYVVRFNVVSEAAVRDSELEWTVLRASGFMSNTLRWLPQLLRGDTVVEPFADVPIAVIDPFDIADVAIHALLDEGHAGRSYRLTGPQALLPSQRLDTLARVLNRKLQLSPQSDEAARREMQESMPGPLVDAFFQFFRGGGYDDSRIDETARVLLDRPLRTFPEWAHAHAEAFQGKSSEQR